MNFFNSITSNLRSELSRKLSGDSSERTISPSDFEYFNNTPGNEIISGLSDLWDTILHGNQTKLNKQIADQNLAFQKDNLEYQKQLQQQIFDREDSSYERMVSSARAAGLSPLGLQGLSSGEAIPTQPLSNNMNYQSTSALSAISSVFQTIMGIKSGFAELANLNAQTNKTNAEALAISNKNSLFNLNEERIAYLADLYSRQEDYFSKKLSNYSSSLNNVFNSHFGWSDNMPNWLKVLSFVSNNPILRIHDIGDPMHTRIDSYTYNGIFKGSDDYNQIFDFNKLSDDLMDSITDIGSQLFEKIPGAFGNLIKSFFKGIFGSSDDSALPDLVGYNKKHGSKIDYATKYLALVNHFSRNRNY